MNNKKNTQTTNPVKLNDQPLSSYKYVACGKGFNTIAEMAVYFQVDEDALKEEIESKADRRQKICTGAIQRLRHAKYTYKGKPITVRQIIEMSGLPKSTVARRLQRGWTVERTIYTPLHEKREYDLTVSGKTYANVSELARAFEMPYTTILNRLKKGLTAEEAVRMPINCKGNKALAIQVYVFGKVFESYKALCKEYDINYSTLMGAKKRHPDTALETLILHLIHKPASKYMVHGKGYATIKQLALQYGVEYSLLQMTMHDGTLDGITFDTIEEIIDYLQKRDEIKEKEKKAREKKLKKEETEKLAAKKKKQFVSCGVVYDSVRDACRKNGIAKTTLYRTIEKMNMTKQEAFAYCIAMKNLELGQAS